MRITINSKDYELDEGKTLAEALETAGVRQQGIAIALNGAVVPSAMWGKTPLVNGDSVLIISAFYGG